MIVFHFLSINSFWHLLFRYWISWSPLIFLTLFIFIPIFFVFCSTYFKLSSTVSSKHCIEFFVSDILLLKVLLFITLMAFSKWYLVENQSFKMLCIKGFCIHLGSLIAYIHLGNVYILLPIIDICICYEELFCFLNVLLYCFLGFQQNWAVGIDSSHIPPAPIYV